ncbi:MAG: MFS transporter [Saprospiraceae bacterium]|nr:MFS transporter [Saprospiraceae bacterium]
MEEAKAGRVPGHILFLIVIAQFCGTSLWFAGNAILPELTAAFDLGPGAVSNLTSAVQLGFISGTLIFAFLNIADLFSPSKVFLISACLGAVFNSLIILAPFGIASLWFYRFLTGFFLAGIYPVGMKIASDWYHGELGKVLGLLVGALVLGTAFPHLLRSFSSDWHWQSILWFTSGIAVLGGLFIALFVSDGPRRMKGSKLKLTAFLEIFRVKSFRSAAMGYFGHMWELYTFWAFVPLLLTSYARHQSLQLPVSFWSFIIISSGALGCTAGGYIALKRGSAKVAFFQLAISGSCCAISLVAFYFSPLLFILFLVIWGITVVGDSPQFSTLVAHTAPRQYIGTALTITNCIGFAITIVSLQLGGILLNLFGINYTMIFLVIGPVLGLLAIKKLIPRKGN